MAKRVRYIVYLQIGSTCAGCLPKSMSSTFLSYSTKHISAKQKGHPSCLGRHCTCSQLVGKMTTFSITHPATKGQGHSPRFNWVRQRSSAKCHCLVRYTVYLQIASSCAGSLPKSTPSMFQRYSAKHISAIKKEEQLQLQTQLSQKMAPFLSGTPQYTESVRRKNDYGDSRMFMFLWNAPPQKAKATSLGETVAYLTCPHHMPINVCASEEDTCMCRER